GVTAVSNHLVVRTFEGTIVWDGAGEISYPSEWTTPLDWGFDCEAAVPEAQSYDLIVEPGAAIDAIELEAVLAYPRSVGAFDPSSAEYVVLLEAGA
ncbi:MAG TPA: hypothetical protein VM869_23420, partial [Enhygromyxa sp.]|nr:hypothetical protein [Enhygromyxa sp.]